MDLIKQRQEEIIEEFSMLDGDMEMTLDYIMELGAELGSFPDSARIEDNIVKGCQSKVWMLAEMENDRIQFRADSNTAITKGLVSLLVRVLNQSSPSDVMNAEIYFPKQIGMDRFIGTQRSNGFAAMIKQMKLYALAYSAKQES
ncbi:SufE family protein [Ekhidna sp.]|uniref:SufE family protein n=1 Tax=Ekhidna sp. TaxID=2608089 RepID=UPI0035197382